MTDFAPPPPSAAWPPADLDHGFWRRLTERIPTGLILMSAEGAVHFANAAATELLGYPPQEFGGRWNPRFIHPDDQPAAQQLFEHILHMPGVPVIAETRVLHKDGSVCWLEGTFTNWLADPDMACIVLSFTDITKRRQAEAARRESEACYTALFAKTAVPSFLLRLPAAVLADANEAAERLTGFTRTEMLGQTAAELGLTQPEAWQAALDKFQQQGYLAGRLEQLHTRSGETRLVQLSGTLVQIAGQPHVISTMLDLTAQLQAETKLRKSEAQYRYLFENNPHPMWAFDQRTLRFLAVNEAAVEKYGYSRDEFLGMTIADIRPADDVARLQAAVREAPNLAHSGNWRHRLKDGTLIDVMIHSHALNFDGREARLIVAQDVTAQRQAAERLQESEVLLRQVLESIPDATFALDQGYRLLINNQRHQQELAASGGHPLQAGDPLLLPDYPAAVLDFWRTAYDRALAGETFSLEGAWTDTHGQPHAHENRLGPLRDAAGAIRGVLVIARDITARRQAEAARDQLLARLNLAAGAAGLGIWEIDLATGAQFGDDRWWALYGQPPAAGGFLAIWRQVVLPEDQAQATDLEAAIRRGAAGFNGEYRVRWRDGSLH